MAGPPYPVPNLTAPIAIVVVDPTTGLYQNATGAVPNATSIPNVTAPIAMVRMDASTGLTY